MTARPDRAAQGGTLARFVDCEVHAGPRGVLASIDFARLPFLPVRAFTVVGAPSGTLRGGHGHRRGEQLLFCVQGRVEARLRAHGAEDLAILEPDGRGLLLGAGVWCSQRYLEEGTVLLVLASEAYDPSTYFSEPGP